MRTFDRECCGGGNVRDLLQRGFHVAGREENEKQETFGMQRSVMRVLAKTALQMKTNNQKMQSEAASIPARRFSSEIEI